MNLLVRNDCSILNEVLSSRFYRKYLPNNVELLAPDNYSFSYLEQEYPNLGKDSSLFQDIVLNHIGNIKNGVFLSVNGSEYKIGENAINSIDKEEFLADIINVDRNLVVINAVLLYGEQIKQLENYRKLTNINDLRKDEITLLLIKLPPHDVLSLCKINQKYRNICKNKDLFTILMKKHYPNAVLTDNPKAQYKAITNDVKTRYKIHLLRDTYHDIITNNNIDSITNVGTSSSFNKISYDDYLLSNITFDIEGLSIPNGMKMWLIIFGNVYSGDDNPFDKIKVFKTKQDSVLSFLEKSYLDILEIIYEDFLSELTDEEVSEDRITEIQGDFGNWYDICNYIIETQPIEWLDFLNRLKLPNPTKENIYDYCMHHDNLIINELFIAQFIEVTF